MKSCRVPVRVDHRTVERLEPTSASAALLVSDDFTPVGGAESRSFDLHGLHFQSQVSPNPFQPPSGTASASFEAPLFGSDRIRRSKGRARLGLSLAGEWVFVADSTRTAELRERDNSLGDEAVAGELIGFVPATSQERGLARLNQSVEQNLPNLTHQINDALSEPAVKQRRPDPVSVVRQPEDEDTVWGGRSGRSSTPRPALAAARHRRTFRQNLTTSGADTPSCGSRRASRSHTST